MALEIFDYLKDAAGRYFDPFSYKKLLFVLERKVLVRSLGEEVLVRVYKMPNEELYLGIVFLDGLVRDGFTVIKNRKRDGYYPVGYIDELGHKAVVSHSMKGVFIKVANLKRFRDVGDMPIKTENVDPLDPLSYWRLVEILYGEPSYQEELKPFLVLKTGKGEIQISLLRRLGRDNIDLYINIFPNEERFLIKGKAGETYLAKGGWITIRTDLEGAFHYLGRYNEDYPIEEVLVLDEETLSRTGLSFHPVLSEIAKRVA
jgi:hypothetical protein